MKERENKQEKKNKTQNPGIRKLATTHRSKSQLYGALAALFIILFIFGNSLIPTFSRTLTSCFLFNNLIPCSKNQTLLCDHKLSPTLECFV